MSMFGYPVLVFDLVDLAGYGATPGRQEHEGILGPHDRNLPDDARAARLILLLLDMRHDPSEDLLMERWLFENGWEYAVVLTKADKLTRQEQAKRLAAFMKSVLPGARDVFPVSAEKRTGLDALWQRMADAAGVENTMPRRDETGSRRPKAGGNAIVCRNRRRRHRTADGADRQHRHNACHAVWPTWGSACCGTASWATIRAG